ncbi:MAG: MYXO-CTERM sorting domain-containing protein [Marmoricola sp.]
MDLLIGMLGFFTFMALVQAAVLEIRGDDAGGAALLLAALLAALVWAVRRRRSLQG